MKKRICRSGLKRQYRSVQANAWSSQLPTSPLFGATILSWAFKNSKSARRWIRSVSSPPLENQQTTSPDSNDDAANYQVLHSTQVSAIDFTGVKPSNLIPNSKLTVHRVVVVVMLELLMPAWEQPAGSSCVGV